MAETKAPPKDEPDFLFDSPEGITPDGLAGWKVDPHTQHAVRTYRTRYNTLAKTLIAQAEASTDPKVATLGARLKELSAVILSMGGKSL